MSGKDFFVRRAGATPSLVQSGNAPTTSGTVDTPFAWPTPKTAHYKLASSHAAKRGARAAVAHLPSMPAYRSKTLATWIAVLGGTLGLHRFYLHGARDLLGWLHPLPTLVGLVGVIRMRELGQDDRLAWLLLPVLGLVLSAVMLTAIVYGLTPDDRWDARHNPGQPVRSTGWGPVLGVILALLAGGIVLMGTLAFAGQKFFEWQLGPAAG